MDGKTMKYLSIAAIVKNEGYYIEEWIKFHRQQGVEHFYIFDNESTDNTVDILKKCNDVTIIHTPGKCMQLYAYNTAIDITRQESKWLALIDADEFLFSVEGKLSDKLKEYEEFGGVAVNWVVFGANGHKTRQSSVLKTHTRRNSKVNLQVKSVIQPSKVKVCVNPHFVNYLPGFFAVDEDKQPVSGPFNRKLSANILRINHYYCKSEEEYIQKVLLGRADYPPNHPLYFRHKEANMSVEDLAAQQVLEDNEVEDTLILEKYDWEL